jgi:hypothetical protein
LRLDVKAYQMPSATMDSPTNNGAAGFAAGPVGRPLEAGIQQKNYELSKEDIEVVSYQIKIFIFPDADFCRFLGCSVNLKTSEFSVKTSTR